MAITKLAEQAVKNIYTEEPGFINSQLAMPRAMRKGETGLDKYLAAPELIGNRQINSLKSGVVGGVGGAGIGALAGLLGGRDPIDAGVGALLGLGVGSYGGMVKGVYDADKEHLESKGISPRMLGLLARMTPEAKEKYLTSRI